ncbi:EmrB/QacA subfamily drug resistance transporter [Actinoplanes lutulentus]|uniref:EmrB/QacA subfamily drug resistance transporter n=1 Tax=Actinoplanes lutulentus TaxID=1287878 RepID=A0A327Z640_9ACTN|nr:DHA2 family efflux MFS transporter permease subunit [Actinoplanes lutulentus]MBB2945163.1 EmrB/QacA subfamily drug resistance transporter [Actinoplanes lutulentus]RAK31959.1 EmrB/QacA subfamily drug resistance transporter [Actinoplanes lutulentus]
MSSVRYGTPAGRWVLLAMVLGSSMAFVDSTIVNLALPTIADNLGASASGLQWTINGYALSLASLILLGGSLGDRFGRRRTFQAGVAWFAVASLLCGIAPNVELLIAARVLQGIGGALLTPGALAILQASFAAQDRARAIGAWSGLGGIGGALGPLLGGWLLELGSWRILFLINVPVAALVLWITARHVPESRNETASRRIDVAGLLTAAIGLGGLTYGFTAWPENGPGSAVVILSLAAGVLGLVAFVLVERREKDPMLPIRIFQNRAFSGANLVTFLVYTANGGVFFLFVLNLQVVADFPAIAAGLALLPLTLLLLVLSAPAGTLGQRIGPRIPMTAGPLICAAALVLMSSIGPGASYLTDVLPAVVIFGLGLALLVAPLTATALSAIDDAYAGIASGVNNAVARSAGLLAVAILPLLGGLGAGSLTDPVALEPVYHDAMLICAGLMAAGAVVAFLAIPARTPKSETPARSFCDPASTPVHR